MLIIEPHNNVTWRTGPHGLKVQLADAITFAAESGECKPVVKNAQGEIVPDPPYVPPQHHAAYRYFRFSQAAQNVFDGYRNMFLALESMLDHIARLCNDRPENGKIVRAGNCLSSPNGRLLTYRCKARSAELDV